MKHLKNLLSQPSAGKASAAVVGQPSAHRRYSRLKHLALMLCFLLGTLNVWAEDVVVTLDNIGASIGGTANTSASTTDITATETSDSYTLNYYQCKKQGNAMLMTKSVSPYISNKTPMPGNIKSVEVFINSGASGKTTYNCAFSATECNAANAATGVGAVNITGGNSNTFEADVEGKYFLITLGNANNGQVLKLVITCDGESGSGQTGGSMTPYPTSVEVGQEGEDNGSISIEYSGITDMTNVDDVKIYSDAEHTNEITNTIDWLAADWNSGKTAVEYIVGANTGAARTAYIYLSATDDNDAAVEKVIEVSQAAYVAPVDPTITFNDGSVEVGGFLDISTLFTSDSEGTVTYSVTVGGDNASISGTTLTGVAVGEVTVQASQAAATGYNAKVVTCTVNVIAAQPKSILNFTAACGGSGTADDDAVWTVTSDGSESSFDNTKGIHYGTGSAAVQYIQLATSDIEGTITKVVVNASTASGVSATASVTIGGDAFGGDAQSLSTSAAEYTFTGSASGEIVVLVTKPSSATKAIYVKSIVVYYIAAPSKTPAGLAYDDSDLSNLVKLGGAFTAPTLANPNSLTVTYTSSNTDVAEVAANGAVTIKAVGVAEITASSEETDTYKAGSAKYTIYVVAHEGTEADPYTVADARVIIDKVGETGIADKYTKGIVSNVKSLDPSKYQRAQYYISDNGERENEIYVYNGYYLSGADFTSADQLMVGDEVVVKGQILKYNKTTYEVAQDNQLVSLNRTKTEAGLEYAETAIEKNIGDAAFTNTLTNPNSLEVSYSSTATDVATVDENGEVTIVGMGTTTIKATFAGNASYVADEVSYTLTVNDPSLVKVTFDATVDIASDNAEGITKNGVNIKASHVDGVNGSNNPINYYQCFKNETFTATCTLGDIKRIEFSCTSSNPASGFGESYADGVWTGSAAVIELKATEKQVQMNTVTVYYKVDARAEAGLAYETTAIDKHVGDAAFVNTLTNPNNLTVAYESSNTDVAEVAANGTVTIKAEGSATITATFAGNDDYKPATVSYNITVNEAGLDNVTFDSSEDHAESGETTITKSGFTLSFTSGSMDGTQAEYRLYKSQTMTLSSTDYLIKKIEFTCTSGNPISGFADATGLDKDNNEWTGESNTVELTASNNQVRMTKIKVFYVEDTRAAAGLAWNPADDIEITVGDAFSAPALQNPNSIDAAEISIASSNENVATINNSGEIELVADATGTTTISATFAGNASYKPATVSYKITVNPAYSIYVQPSLNVNFGSVNQNAEVADKSITVTLTGVDAATLTLEGTGASAFTISPAAALTASGDVTISASSANIGTFAATLTISDDANNAESKVVNISITVNEVVTPETPVSTTSEWVAATEIVNGMKVLIVGEKNEKIYAVGAQTSNNRTAVEGSLSEGVFTPGENTMAFTVVAQEGGTYALQASNGKYLYAAGSGSGKNYLRSQDEVDDNAKWTLSVSSATANGTNTNNKLQLNNNSDIFSCYSSTQKAIALYVPQTYSVTYSANGGSGEAPAAVKYVEGATFTVAAANLFTAPEGKEFDKWNDGTTDYAPGDLYTVGTSNVVLTAQWKDAAPALNWQSTGRTGLISGEFYTICMKKKITHVKGAIFWHILYRDESEEMVYLESVELPLEAGMPYFFQATDDNEGKLDVVYEGDAVNAPKNANGLYGTFEQMGKEALMNMYLLTDDNMLHQVTDASGADVNLPAFRAYVNRNAISEEVQSAPGRRRVAMAMPRPEQTPTALETIDAAALNGQKVVINGHLYIVRDGRMFDATGRLVK